MDDHKEPNHRAASDVLRNVVNGNNADYISVGEIKNSLHERGFGILLLVFAFPLSIPFPVPPGFTAVPSIPLILFSIQMIMGLDSPWLPKWVSKKKLKRSTLAAIIEKTAPYLMKVEKLLHPRFSFSATRTGEKFVGVVCLIFSISIAVPLPLTNFIPAMGITVISLGLLSKDGVTIIVGMVIGSIGITITTLIILLGKDAVMALFGAFL